LVFHDLYPAGVVTSEEARAYKPQREIFDFALHKFGLSSDEILYIGDSVRSDVLGAGAAGIQAVWINRKGRKKPPGVERQAAGLMEIVALLEKENII
ncbi:MAG: HAD family hydrolase, partial [Oscillospiraceae bacterium]|nr:HAD family hydrolase [Oscillospiraceae bacterium]